MAGPSQEKSSKRHSSPDLDDALAFRIHRTNRLLRTHLSRFLDQHDPGLTPEQWFVLARLAQRAPIRQIDLAEPVLGDPPNVSRLVDVLVSRGYVERSPDPTDRRSSLLALTRQGTAVAKALLQHAISERQAAFAGFSDAELDQLATALDRIDANVRRLLAARSDASGSRDRPTCGLSQ